MIFKYLKLNIIFRYLISMEYLTSKEKQQYEKHHPNLNQEYAYYPALPVPKSDNDIMSMDIEHSQSDAQHIEDYPGNVVGNNQNYDPRNNEVVFANRNDELIQKYNEDAEFKSEIRRGFLI